MKRILPFIILFICSTAEAKIFIKPFDSIGVNNISNDIRATECAINEIPKYDGSKWQCGTDSTVAGAGGNSVYVSKDGTAVFNNAAADMYMEFGAGLDWSGSGQRRRAFFDATEVSGDKTWAGGEINEIGWTWNLSAGDPTVTFKNGRTNISGDFSVSADLYALGDDIVGTTNTDRFAWLGDGTNYSPEAIDLGTDTGGNYVASLATTSPITGGAAGSEGATLTIAIPAAQAGVNGYMPGVSMTSIDTLVAASHDAVTLAGENYLSLSGQQITANTVNDTNLTSEDFGDFTCDSNEDGCTLDADVVSNDELAPQAVSTDQLLAVNKPTDGQVLSYEADNLGGKWISSAGGFTNLTDFDTQTAWRVFYSDGNGDTTELALGADNTVLTSTGASSAPAFEAAAGSSTFSQTFRVETAKLPLVNPAQIDAGKSGWRLLFDASTSERVSFDTLLTPYSGGSISADVQYTMTSATSGGVGIAIFGECITPGDSADIDAGSYGNINSGAQTVPGTAGYLSQLGVGMGNPDSCAQGDRFRFMVSRDTVSTDDTATGDFELRKIRIYEQ